MNPYYADGAVTLYHGDCREVLPTLEHGGRVIADPPYGFGAYPTDVALPAQVFAGLVARHRTVALFGYPEQLARLCGVLAAAPREWVVWWPTNATFIGQRGADLPREHQAVAVFGEVPGARRLVRPRVQEPTALRIIAARGKALDTARMGDVWRDASPGVGFNARLRRHPNEKPESLLRRLLVLCSDPGDIVVDPCAGSGTTLVAALQEGRRAIGIEVDERYCEVAADRLRKVQPALALFGEAAG